MGKIITLNSELIPKIAAGEVVERPASVVKELLENALDAHATKIDIDIEKAGFDLIRVVDDGDGMDQKDLLKCFLPYTTSKIQNESDLNAIKTLGFRGEALSSISAVSALYIKSRLKTAQQGNLVHILFGVFENIIPVGMSAGTCVEVKNLFGNVPARKKFLKSESTEFRHILNIVSGYCLCHQNISLTLSHNGKRVFSFNKSDTQFRLATLLGKTVQSNLLQVSYEDTRLQILGFISKPQAASHSTETQYLFVNHRYVSNSQITKTIFNAYETTLEASTHPPFVLFINCSADLVDVNVHPRKEEVRFWDSDYVNTCVQKAVKQTLADNNLTYTSSTDDAAIYKGASKNLYGKLKDSAHAWKVTDELPEDTQILQVDKTFLIYSDHGELVVIDQHSAHESILFDQFSKAYKAKNSHAATTVLAKPFILQLSVLEAQTLCDHLDTLNTIGFEINPFGNNEFRISAVPELAKDFDLTKFIKELLADLSETGTLKDIDSISRRTIEFLSCRTAVKAGDYLDPAERKNLVTKLRESSDLYTCPHGRPVKVIVTKHDLAKMFKRVK